MTVSAGRALGHEMLANWETDSVDGIFAGNDLIALGILQAFVMSKTLRVPHDVRLVGFDDIDFAQSAIVSLTSIRQPAEEIGRAAVATLLTKFEHPETPAKVVKFEPELIVRDSS
jgi:LacI family transcriptional regulator